MTKEPSSAESEPEAERNASSRNATVGRLSGFLSGRLTPFSALLLLAGLAAAGFMIAAEFSTLRSVKVLTASCADLADPQLRGSCVTRGGEEHSYALVLLGVVSALMAWGAFAGRSRPAAMALAAVGAAVLAIALITDVPDTNKTGVLGERFEQASAQAGPGLWLEIAGGGLAFALGVAGATGRIGAPRRVEREPRRTAEEAA
jgi:hypothetical protein